MHNNYLFINYDHYIQAILHYRKALQLNPDDGETHYELGTLLLSMVSVSIDRGTQLFQREHALRHS